MASHSNLSTSATTSRGLTPFATYRPGSCPEPSTARKINAPLSPPRGPTVAASLITASARPHPSPAVGRGFGLEVTVDDPVFTPETPALTLGNSSTSPPHEGLASGSDRDSGDDDDAAARSCQASSSTSIPLPVAQVLQQAQYPRKHRRNRRKPTVQRAPAVVMANPPAPPPPTPARVVQQHQQQQPPRRRIPLLTADQQRVWVEKGKCTYVPLGTCAAETINGSAYCAMHSCRAENADGELCLNLVVDPAHSRYCHTGYHAETERHHHVTALVRKRQEHNFLEAKARQEKFENGVAFFDANFSSSGASSRASTSPSQSFIGLSDLGQQATTPTRTYSASHLEPRWGAHNDDKWWVGEWSRLGEWPRPYATVHNTPH